MDERVWIDDGPLVLSLQVLMPLFCCWFHLYLSILIQLHTMKQTKRGTGEDSSEKHYHTVALVCATERFLFLYVKLVSGHWNDKKKKAN